LLKKKIGTAPSQVRVSGAFCRSFLISEHSEPKGVSSDRNQVIHMIDVVSYHKTCSSVMDLSITASMTSVVLLPLIVRSPEAEPGGEGGGPCRWWAVTSLCFVRPCYRGFTVCAEGKRRAKMATHCASNPCYSLHINDTCPDVRQSGGRQTLTST
jgi:hypothetical protein